MKNIKAIALTLLAALTLGSVAVAQGPGGPGGRGPREPNWTDLTAKLHLKPAQVNRLKVLRTQATANMSAIRANAKLSDDQKRSESAKIRKNFEAGVKKTLSATQWKELDIEGGSGLILNGRSQMAMFESLGLTSAQRAKIGAILSASRKQMEAMRDNPKMSREDQRTKMRSMMEGNMKKIEAILTPAQRAKMQSMRPRGGPGGFGGGPGGAGGRRGGGGR